MSDSEFPDVQLTAVEQLVEKQKQRLLRETAKETEQYILRAVEQTDWSVVEILDVVEMVALTETDTVSSPEDFSMATTTFRVYRYERTWQAPESYDYNLHWATNIYRITEQVCREVGIDPDTGVVTHD